MSTIDSGPLRIGAVSYLNSKPLIEGLQDLLPEAELVLDYPSRLADELAAGRLDVALVPSIECLRNPDYTVVSDACVATRGPVLSVKLYSRVPIGEIRTLALDDGSRTSAVLARIMLAERYGVEPLLEPLPMGLGTEATEADAVLLIGDRAMHVPDEVFAETWDLGQEWSDWTGLPFVFAHWAARTPIGEPGLVRKVGPDLTGQCGGLKPALPRELRKEASSVGEALSRARDLGLQRAEEIARREAPLLGIPAGRAVDYLTRNLHFTLGSAERNGLQLFRQLAAGHGFVPRREAERLCI